MKIRSVLCLSLIWLSLGLIGCGGTTRIHAGGATFIGPIMDRWASEYRNKTGVEIDYAKTGSGQGIRDMAARNILFGCTDAPMNKDELAKAEAAGGTVFHIPLAMGAVAIIYNLPDIKDLKLSGPVIADIYLGHIKTWNDPRIATLNPGKTLPNLEINRVTRDKDSGTTSIFTDYLSKVSQEFQTRVGIKKNLNDLKDVPGQAGSDGVAQFVKNTPGGLGYVEVAYAYSGGIEYAAIENAAGNFVKPTAAAVTAAAANAITEDKSGEPFTLHDLTYSLTNAKGEQSYPIVGISYAILYQQLPADTGPAAVEFLKWAVTDGQRFAEELHYAPLPEELRKRCLAKLAEVKFQ
jgi:phosphate ABC transporter phosphate-binding protein